MFEQGKLVAVQAITLGADLAEDALTGAETLTLENVFDFADDGGEASVGSEDLTYSARDTDALTITLDAPTAADHFAGDRVLVVPEARRFLGHVQIDGEEDEVVLVRISHALKMHLPNGIRDPDEQESVLIEQRNGTWWLSELVGVVPGLVGGTIDVPDVDNPYFHVGRQGSVTVKPAGGNPAIDILDPSNDGTFIRLRYNDGADEFLLIDYDGLASLAGIKYYGLLADYPHDPADVALNYGALAFKDDVLIGWVSTHAIRLSALSGGIADLEWGGGSGNGQSKLDRNDFIELAEKNADPGGTPPTGAVRIYSKVIAGTSKLFAQDDAGGIHPLW